MRRGVDVWRIGAFGRPTRCEHHRETPSNRTLHRRQGSATVGGGTRRAAEKFELLSLGCAKSARPGHCASCQALAVERRVGIRFAEVEGKEVSACPNDDPLATGSHPNPPRVNLLTRYCTNAAKSWAWWASSFGGRPATSCISCWSIAPRSAELHPQQSPDPVLAVLYGPGSDPDRSESIVGDFLSKASHPPRRLRCQPLRDADSDGSADCDDADRVIRWRYPFAYETRRRHRPGLRHPGRR